LENKEKTSHKDTETQRNKKELLDEIINMKPTNKNAIQFFCLKDLL